MSNSDSRVQWSEKEWMQVLAVAVPLAQSEKVALLDAVLQVQSKVLARERLRKTPTIRNALNNAKRVALCMKRLNAMTDLERAALIAPPDSPAMPVQVHPPGRMRFSITERERERSHRMPGGSVTVKLIRATYHGGSHWSDQEWALLARTVDSLPAGGKYGGELQRVYVAQDLIFPYERRRSIDGLSKSNSNPRDPFKLPDCLALGRKNRHLVSHIPLDWRAPDALTMESAQAWLYPSDTPPPAPEVAPVTTQAIPPAPTAAAEAEADDAKAPAQAPSAPATAPAPAAPVSPLAQRFAGAIAGAVDDLLTEHGRSLMAQVESHIAALLAPLAERVAGAVGNDIKDNLARVVHLLMESELGPIPAPTYGQAREVEGPPRPTLNGHGETVAGQMPEAPPPRRIPIDVLGLTGHPETIVREALRDYPNLDMRFLEPSQSKQITMRENVILVNKFSSHSTLNRARKQGVKLVTVNGAAQSVIGAVYNILRSEGIGVAQHH